MRMLNRNPKRLSAEVFSSAQKQPKQNANSQNRKENGSTTLRNTREKPLLAGYLKIILLFDKVDQNVYKPLTRAFRYILIKPFFLAIGWSYLHDLSHPFLKGLKLL